MSKNVKKSNGISIFQKYLTVWVILCMVVGVLIGKFLPAVPAFLDELSIAGISIPIAILIWVMIYPMMMKVDFQSVKQVGKNPKGLFVTWIVNWLIKPFTMYAIASVFLFTVFKGLIALELATEYLAGAVLLGAAPCTAMVFVWSTLTNGNPAYTVVQVATNDLIILVAFVPIVKFLLGVSNVTVPYSTLFLSVFLFVVIPLVGGIVTRVGVIKSKGQEYFEDTFIHKFDNATTVGLLLTLIIIFASQTEVILSNPLHIILIAVPLIIQTCLIFAIAYVACKILKLPHDVAAPAGMIGASNFFELAVAVAIALFGTTSSAALATTVGVLTEVPVMLFLVKIANQTKKWFDKEVRKLKIRKVDDKPMVIHTKEKAKIHAHEPKGAKIKGSNIYTVERGPKTAGAKVTDTDRKKSYRKSTIHQSESKNKGLSRFKRNLRESNTSIKTKNANLHVAGRTGALAAGVVTDQVEGGQEVSQAAYLAYEASRPVTGTASKGVSLFRKKAAAEARKRIKKVDAGKKLAKKTAKKAAKDTAKTAAKETAKETAKTTAKIATKTATKAATTAAGTAVAPGVGTAIGMAAGYAAGVSIEVKDEKMTNRSRKIKFFLDKMKAQENQTDSVAKLVKDLIVRKAITWVKAAAPIIGLVLLLLVLVVAMIAVPVIAVIAILYNSPFALFLPPLESGDTVQTVTSAYVQEFNRDVNTKVNEHTGYDLGELVYVDYEGMEENPSNYYDIMAVYMVKYGVGDTATVMNDKSKGWLQAVVNDMCSYTTSTGIKNVEETDDEGNVTTVTKSVLYVNVTLKSYRDMISLYGFNSNQVEMLEQIMSDDFMGQLGYAGSGSGGGGGSPRVSSMTEDEINARVIGERIFIYECRRNIKAYWYLLGNLPILGT